MSDEWMPSTHPESCMVRTGVTSAAMSHLCQHKQITETSLGCLSVG